MGMQPGGGRYSIDVAISFDIDEVPDSVKALKPVIYSDADMFLCQLGTNLFEGITGHGRTPQEAMAKFDKEFQRWLDEGKIPEWQYYKRSRSKSEAAVSTIGEPS
jgi:hypothetical protein